MYHMCAKQPPLNAHAYIYRELFALCADPESFARGGPTLTTFFQMMRERGTIQIPLKVDNYRPASETPLKWRALTGR